MGGTNVTGECECISGGCLCSWTRVRGIVILKVVLSSFVNSSLTNGGMQSAVISSQQVCCCQSSVFLSLFLQAEITQKIRVRQIVLGDPDWIKRVAVLLYDLLYETCCMDHITRSDWKWWAYWTKRTSTHLASDSSIQGKDPLMLESASDGVLPSSSITQWELSPE